ncbi:MAG: hypothetical protein FWH23_07000 [Bacteroidales bacterium]|nr:hypothetical protein [Bacteroidales bacterium]MCL2133463.1 hypothetical protein [Bacteroidales bacterium]
MNNTFSYHRFLLMLRKEAADLRPQFIKILLISFGIGLIIFFFINYSFGISGNSSFEIVRFVIGALVVVCNILFAPFILYKRFNYRTTGVNHFMLPASQLEKWLSMFFYCLIVTPLLSIAALTLADLCLLPVYPLAGTTLWFSDDSVSHIFAFMPTVNFFIYILIYQSLFFFCNIWFQRSKVQKTFAVLIIISVVSTLFSTLLAGLFPIANVEDLVKITVENTNEMQIATTLIRSVYEGPTPWPTVALLLSVCTFLGIYYAGFLKWKEQEL